MTTVDPNMGETPRDDIIAAEYVLGVLPVADRKAVEKRLETDRDFARLVSTWETNFASLNAEYEPIRPPAGTLAQIERRLFETATQKGTASFGIWSSLAFWRGMTALTSAAAIAAIVSIFILPPVPQPMSYMAELSSPDVPMAVMVAYNARSGKMVLTPMAANGDQQKSLQLWLINADGTPHSLGVVDPHQDAQIVVPVEMRDQLQDGMTLAVSLEPYGGSPTGRPTGPVLASGTTQQL